MVLFLSASTIRAFIKYITDQYNWSAHCSQCRKAKHNTMGKSIKEMGTVYWVRRITNNSHLFHFSQWQTTNWQSDLCYLPSFLQPDLFLQRGSTATNNIMLIFWDFSDFLFALLLRFFLTKLTEITLDFELDSWYGLMNGNICLWLVHHFGQVWNISTTFWWITVTFGTNIQNALGGWITITLVMPWLFI